MPFALKRLSEPPVQERGAVLDFPAPPVDRRAVNGAPTSSDLETLDTLRAWLARSRLSGESPSEHACALITAPSRESAERSAIQLFRALPWASRRRLVFHRRGAVSVTTDEMWLLRLLYAIRQGNRDSEAALLGFRIQPSARRWIRCLAHNLANGVEALSTG